jgi:YggT family protein
MILYLVDLVNLAVWLLSAVLIVDALVSFVLDPWHPVRRFLDRLARPFVEPFRRLLPPVGGLDFSIMAALVVIQLVGQLLTRIMLGR